MWNGKEAGGSGRIVKEKEIRDPGIGKMEEGEKMERMRERTSGRGGAYLGMSNEQMVVYTSMNLPFKISL